MEIKSFKTNINCSNCEKKVKPFLDQIHPEWKIDLHNPDKILSIETQLTPDEVIRQIKKAGFTASEL